MEIPVIIKLIGGMLIIIWLWIFVKTTTSMLVLSRYRNDYTMAQKIDQVIGLLRAVQDTAIIITDLDPLFFSNAKICKILGEMSRNKTKKLEIIVDKRCEEKLMNGFRYPEQNVYENLVKEVNPHCFKISRYYLSHHLMITDWKCIRLEHPHEYHKFGYLERTHLTKPQDEKEIINFYLFPEEYGKMKWWIIRKLFSLHKMLGITQINEYATILYEVREVVEQFKPMVDEIRKNSTPLPLIA
ncbi:MAG: hypothetical protein AB1349_10445 [Elusimicrobiota bacterium]